MTSKLEETMAFAELLFALAKELDDGTICQKMEGKKGNLKVQPNSLFYQVWSLSSFEVSRQVSRNDLNQISSVSLLMISLTALANEGLFDLTRHPWLIRAMSLSFAETIEEPGYSQVKWPKFC